MMIMIRRITVELIFLSIRIISIEHDLLIVKSKLPSTNLNFSLHHRISRIFLILLYIYNINKESSKNVFLISDVHYSN